MREIPAAAISFGGLLVLSGALSLNGCTSSDGTGSDSPARGGSGGTDTLTGGTKSTGGTTIPVSGGSNGSGGTATGGARSMGGAAGSASGGGTNGGATSGGGPAESAFRLANLTNFESYPDPNSEECVEYNGCMWAGQFAGVDGVQPESWVMAHNIVAVHSKDFEKYKLKTLRLRQGTRQIDVTVYDMCADSDCDGCCTANSAETGFLIDIEKYTMQRFGSGDGVVEFACLDCP